jgi:hypothetical protein
MNRNTVKILNTHRSPEQRAEMKMNNELSHTILDVNLVVLPYYLISILEDLKNKM